MIDAKFKKEDQYRLLLQQIDSIVEITNPIVTNLSNVIAAINETFDNVSWVGFYLVKNSYLFLGPFQGKVACTRIEFGNGVCGKAPAPSICDFRQEI